MSLKRSITIMVRSMTKTSLILLKLIIFRYLMFLIISLKIWMISTRGTSQFMKLVVKN